MKRKILCIVLLFFALPIMAFTTDSVAIYKGTTATVRAYDLFLKEMASATVSASEVKKLTKEESNLLWKALREYDYKAGEVYEVIIYTIFGSIYSPTIFNTSLFVEIQKDGDRKSVV